MCVGVGVCVFVCVGGGVGGVGGAWETIGGTESTYTHNYIDELEFELHGR